MRKISSTPKADRKSKKSGAAKPAATSKLDKLLTLLRKASGASIAELATATEWQTHSVRGALAGTLKKKGHTISSEVVGGVRRYHIAEARP